MKIKSPVFKIVLLVLAPLLIIVYTKVRSFDVMPSSSDIIRNDTCLPAYKENFSNYNKYLPFINYTQNYFEWENRSAISSFFEKLNKVHERKLKIVHIGDSHIQADMFTGYVREEMQNSFGAGGRGMIFPYAAIKTHSTYDYKTEFTGDWDYSKNTSQEPTYSLGLSGASIYTKDENASFSFQFKCGIIQKEFREIKLYYKKMPASFDIKLKYSSKYPEIIIKAEHDAEKSYTKVIVPAAIESIEVTFVKENNKQFFFEFYGLSIESVEDNGVLYYSVGINGAGYRSILRQDLMQKQLADIKPDLVVMDLGANDFYFDGLNSTKMADNLEEIINRIRDVAPETSFLISNTQDICPKDNDDCYRFSNMTKKVAYKMNCAFYNYYCVSGGSNSVYDWGIHNFMKGDQIHLTKEGYVLKGQLFLNAMLNSYKHFKENPEVQSLLLKDTIIESQTIINALPREEILDNISKKEERKTKFDTLVYHVVSGDNLINIAKKYGVIVNDVKKWNKLKESKIQVGQKLLIYQEQ